jgi:hypothetical protein
MRPKPVQWFNESKLAAAMEKLWEDRHGGHVKLAQGCVRLMLEQFGPRGAQFDQCTYDVATGPKRITVTIFVPDRGLLRVDYRAANGVADITFDPTVVTLPDWMQRDNGTSWLH